MEKKKSGANEIEINSGNRTESNRTKLHNYSLKVKSYFVYELKLNTKTINDNGQ